MRPTALPLVVVLALAAPAAVGAQPVEWLASEWSGEGHGPDVVLEPSGGVNLTFAQSSGFARRIRFSAGGSQNSDDSFDEWFGETDPAAFGPAIASQPDGTLHLVFKTSAGGTSWSTWVSRRTTTWTIPPLLIGLDIDRGYGAQVAADAGGATVAITEADGDPEATVRTWTLIDGLVTGEVTSVMPARSDDRLDVVAGPADGERYLFAGVPDPIGAVNWVHSSNGGATWTSPSQIVPPSCLGAPIGQPDAATSPVNGVVHLVYGCAWDSEVSGPSLRHARLEGGAVLDDVRIDAADTLQDWALGHGIARVAVTLVGTIVVVFVDQPGGALRSTSSDDGGATWHPSIELASSTTDVVADGPTIAASGRVVFVFWSDGGTVTMRRGLGPIEADPGDDDDTPGDDDDTSGDDDDDSGDDDSEGDDDSLGDDDSALPPGDQAGCCDQEGEGTPSGALLLLLMGAMRRGGSRTDRRAHATDRRR